MKYKKSMVVLSALLIVGISCCTVIKSKAATVKKTEVVCETSASICQEVSEGYNNGTKGPMMLVEGVLEDNGIEKDVYLVTLSGTEDVDGQCTNWATDIKTAFELNNDYKKNVKEKILENIPQNSNLILAGHSLGGMVAQQLSSDRQIKKKYNILRTIAYGSPLISPYNKEGIVKRFVDAADIVPHLSISNILTKKANKFEAQINCVMSEYNNFMEAHLESYKDEDVWDGYDCLGDKNGDAKISFYKEDKVYFKCPTLN